MNENNIRTYAKIMNEMGLTGLEITEGDKVLRLERAAASAPVVPVPIPQDAPKAESPVDEGKCVTSPMVGVFYAAPAENAEPFVQPGQRVQKGQTLCIIEAMKLMNEITADRDGGNIWPLNLEDMSRAGVEIVSSAEFKTQNMK